MMQGISIVFVPLITVAFGCSSAHPPAAAAEYRTLGRDPRRDTDRARSLNDRAADAIRQGNYAEGEKLLRDALAADVMFGPAHNNLGKVYFAQKNLYLAAWEFTYAAKLMKDQPEPRNNLGLVFEASGKFDEAVAEYTEARKVKSDNAEFLGNEARARLRRGDRDAQVRELLEHLIAVDTRPAWIEWARQRLTLLNASQSFQRQQIRDSKKDDKNAHCRAQDDSPR
jgi:Tfp pilus assembly protein PilF